MASSTPPQGAFFSGFGTQSDKKKQETFKIPDNPHLSQRLTTTTRNENAVVLKSSTNHHHDNDSLRQRRPLQEQQQQALAKPASSFNPPKSSLSLRTSRKSVPMDQARSQIVVRRNDDDAILPSNSGCWVMVYGIVNESHYDLCKDYFGKLGNIIATRGSFVPGRQNWVALQYESPLQAEKAKLQRDVELKPGIFCGIRGLPDNDPVLLHSTTSSSGLEEIWGDTSVKRLATSEGGITENDLFLGKKEETDLRSKKRNCCDRFMCWILRLDD